MSETQLLEFIVNGFVLGSLYVVMAIGLSLIFGMIGLVNFAHGVLYTLGAYGALVLKRHLGFWGGMTISPVLVGMIGMGIEALFLRRMYRAAPEIGLLFTFGLAMVLEQLVRMVWGPTGIPFDIPSLLFGSWSFGPFTYSRYRLFILLFSFLLIAGLWFFLQKTPYGMIIRAGSRDPEMVRALGISLKPIFTFVFGLGVALAALSGVLTAPLAGVQPAMGTNVGTAAFVVVTIGGLGSFWGAVVAGLLVGEVISLSILVWPPMAEASMYVLMIMVLLLRPRGLWGEKWERFD
jgi:branched-chain amino acid transport system permease protein